MRKIHYFTTAAVVAFVLASLHCGTDGESTFGAAATPCDGVYRGRCGGACTTDSDCPASLYCASGHCGADCAPDVACTGGMACSPRGRCGVDPSPTSFGDPTGDDAGANPPACADIDVKLTKIVPKVVFLLDQSSSMFRTKFPSGNSNNCTPDCRWTVLKDVLIGPSSSPGGLVKQLEGQADLAVEMYSATDSNPDDGDNSFLTGPTDNVCPRFNGKAFDGLTFQRNAFTTVDALLRPANVDDDTPTGPAIRTVVGLAADGGVEDGGFAAVADSAPKVLVLVTDGEPAVCGDNNPSDPGRAAVVSAVQDAFKSSVRTFVIAIGDNSPQAVAHFDAVANAGAGLDPATGDAGAIQPTTPEQLVGALRGIVLDARTCTFDLNGRVEEGKEQLGTVTLNGTTVPYVGGDAGSSGWRLVNPSRLELIGDACATLKSSEEAQLTARFPCGALTPVN